MNKTTYEPRPIILPKGAPIHRTFPFKGPNQVDWIDDTIFYDVFYKHDNSAIICIGPPLLNLEEALELQEISCNGKQLRYRCTKFFEGYTLISIKVPRFLREELTVQLSFHFNLFEKIVEVVPNHPPARENGKSLLTLVTLQKDNPLEWIRDWMRWHNRMHGVGQLILYDNGSREYGYDELADTLHGEEEDSQSVLVNWDFPYTWDGQDDRRPTWCPWPQIAALNHCYLKYGGYGWLLNADIDEYLVAKDAISLRDYLRQRPRHYHHLCLITSMVVGIGPEKRLAERSFRDFLWRKNNRYPSKYTCQCNMPLWLSTHLIYYKGYRGFMISTFQTIQTKLDSIVRRLRKLFNYSTIQLFEHYVVSLTLPWLKPGVLE